MISKKTMALIAGPLFALLFAGLLSLSTSISSEAIICAGISFWTALWWMLEPVPIPVASLLPLALFPLFGILSHEQIASAYGHKLILLLMGGFMMSTAMERSGAHLRVANILLRFVGTNSPRRIVLGFMIASAFLSMWISNTATSLMLLPIAIAVISNKKQEFLTVPLLLGVAYGASIGGIATPVGTPPNAVFMAHYEELLLDPAYADLVTQFHLTPITFLGWMKIGLLGVVLFLPIAWLFLTRNLPKSTKQNIIIADLGVWTKAERRTLLVFGIVIAAWIFRANPAGGWSAWLNLPSAWDSTVALLGVILFFVVPNGKGEQLLDWPTALKIPWGLLILFGGGLAIGKAFGASGLSAAIGSALVGITTLPLVLMFAIIALVVTFATELTSNTATTSLLMPLLAGTALAATIDPQLLMIPAALSASFAFMLPVATPPNAVIFGSGRIQIHKMAREGIVLNLIGAIIVVAIMILLQKGFL